MLLLFLAIFALASFSDKILIKFTLINPMARVSNPGTLAISHFPGADGRIRTNGLRITSAGNGLCIVWRSLQRLILPCFVSSSSQEEDRPLLPLVFDVCSQIAPIPKPISPVIIRLLWLSDPKTLLGSPAIVMPFDAPEGYLKN